MLSCFLASKPSKDQMCELFGFRFPSLVCPFGGTAPWSPVVFESPDCLFSLFTFGFSLTFPFRFAWNPTNDLRDGISWGITFLIPSVHLRVARRKPLSQRFLQPLCVVHWFRLWLHRPLPRKRVPLVCDGFIHRFPEEEKKHGGTPHRFFRFYAA